MKKLVFKFFYRIFILSSLLMVTFFLFGCGITGKAVYASSSVYCALYDLDLKNVIAALTNKSRKIEVKIVMDNDNNDNLIKGENARFDDNKQLMHNKFCVIDGRIVITGSFNPTNNDNYNNNNNMLVIYSDTLSKNYKNEFDDL